MITLYFAYLRILASNFHCNLKKYMKSLEIFGNKISKCPIIILKNTPLPALSSKELKLYLFHRLYYPVQQSSFKFHKDLIFRWGDIWKIERCVFFAATLSKVENNAKLRPDLLRLGLSLATKRKAHLSNRKRKCHWEANILFISEKNCFIDS